MPPPPLPPAEASPPPGGRPAPGAMNTRVYSLGPVATGPPAEAALPCEGKLKTCVALAGGGPPKDGGADGGTDRTGFPPGLPNICVNSPPAPRGFDGNSGCDGNENGVAGTPSVEGELGPPPELNIRVNSPGCPPPEIPGVWGRLGGGGAPPPGELNKLAKSVGAGGLPGSAEAIGGGALPGGALNIRVNSPPFAGGAAAGGGILGGSGAAGGGAALTDCALNIRVNSPTGATGAGGGAA